MPLFLERIEEGRQYFDIKTNTFHTNQMPLKLHAQLSQKFLHLSQCKMQMCAHDSETNVQKSLKLNEHS